MMIDQMSFDNYSSSASLGSIILTINNSQPTTQNVGVGMHPSLIGTFSCHVPVLMIGSIPGGNSSS